MLISKYTKVSRDDRHHCELHILENDEGYQLSEININGSVIKEMCFDYAEAEKIEAFLRQERLKA